MVLKLPCTVSTQPCFLTQGVRYFKCAPNRGLFVSNQNIFPQDYMLRARKATPRRKYEPASHSSRRKIPQPRQPWDPSTLVPPPTRGKTTKTARPKSASRRRRSMGASNKSTKPNRNAPAHRDVGGAWSPNKADTNIRGQKLLFDDLISRLNHDEIDIVDSPKPDRGRRQPQQRTRAGERGRRHSPSRSESPLEARPSPPHPSPSRKRVSVRSKRQSRGSVKLVAQLYQTKLALKAQKSANRRSRILLEEEKVSAVLQ